MREPILVAVVVAVPINHQVLVMAADLALW
jgi:hypothetical protein